MSTINAKYLVESALDLREVAELIVGEQSTGTFIRVASENDEIRARSRGQVVSVKQTGTVENPSLPSEFNIRHEIKGPFNQGEVQIGFPAPNVSANLPTLMATIAGNIFELGQLTGIRLLDFDIDADYSRQFASPHFSVAGTRKLSGVEDRPILGTIVKPNLGMTPDETAEIVASLCKAGLDFIKDDEVLANPTFCSFDNRTKAVMRVINDHAQATGKKVMYAFNITDEFDTMRRNAELIRSLGGTCAMVSLNWVGYSSVQTLSKDIELPIHGHRNGFAAMSRNSFLGMSGSVYAKSWRLAGVDHLHVNGLQSKFWEPNSSVIETARACVSRLGECSPSVPVFSSGQWAGLLPETVKSFGSGDFMFLAGGGIIGHPDGIASGVESVKQAWVAARDGIELTDHSAANPELCRAIETFGGI